MNTGAAAYKLGLSRSHVRKLCREDILICKKIYRLDETGSRKIWDIKELIRYPNLSDAREKTKGISIGRLRLDLYDQTDIEQEEIAEWNRAETKMKWMELCDNRK